MNTAIRRWSYISKIDEMAKIAIVYAYAQAFEMGSSENNAKTSGKEQLFEKLI